MINSIDVLMQMEIPVHSPTQAVLAIARYREGSLNCDGFTKLLRNISGIEKEFKTRPEAVLTFGYYVQHAVKRHTSGVEINNEDVMKEASTSALAFIENEPWHFVDDESTRALQQREIQQLIVMYPDVTRTVLLELAVRELELSEMTAKELIERELDKKKEVVKSVKRNIVNNKDLAADIMTRMWNGKNRLEVQLAMQDEMGTSKSGARTYFYRCMADPELNLEKEFEVQVEPTTREIMFELMKENINITKSNWFTKTAALGYKQSTAQTYFYLLKKELQVK